MIIHKRIMTLNILIGLIITFIPGHNFLLKIPDVISTCLMPPDNGQCFPLKPKFYYDYTTEQCTGLMHGGCVGSPNVFETKEMCQSVCSKVSTCMMPQPKGDCGNITTKFRYDHKLKKCVPFVHRGCQINENTFPSLDECMEKCGATPPLDDYVPEIKEATKPFSIASCMLPPDKGPCNVYKARYYFDSILRTCQNFVYGGCLGNDNNFDTREECMQACGAVSKCNLPVRKGPCFGIRPRYYFNSKLKQCKPSVFVGCLDSGNTFYTRKECMGECGGVSICTLPSDEGPCAAYMPRYYFDSKTKKCTLFIYGGCLGNANNFFTVAECLKECSDV